MLLTAMLSADPAARPTLWQVRKDLDDARHELEGAAPAGERGREPAGAIAGATASRVAGQLVAVAVLGLAVGLVLGRISATYASGETAAPARDDAGGLPARLDAPRPAAAPEPGELCEPEPESEPALFSSAPGPDVRDAQGEKPRRTRRAAVTTPGQAPLRHGPITHAEAETAAQPALAALRACAGVPGVVIAELTVTRGRGTVQAFNGRPLTPDVGWHACAREAVEAVRYPSSDAPSRVRVRLRAR